MPISESDAWKRAAASADALQVHIATIEINHPAFIEGGHQVAVRFCSDVVDRTFTIEAGAPIDAGAAVTFVGAPFDIEWPQMSEDGAFEAKVKVDNVGREVSKYIDAAAAMNSEAIVTLRSYLSGTPGTVARGPYRYVLHEVTESGGNLTGTIRVADPANMKAFRQVYDQKNFASLLAVA